MSDSGAIMGIVTSWRDVVAADPHFADHVRRTFAVRKHAILATLRRDGSPRISGTEVDFADTGEIYLGMMPGSVKALDLRRDPRLALHCPTEDTPESDPATWLGDGKIAGAAVEVSDSHRVDAAHRFRIDITEVVLTTVGSGGDHLLIQSWHRERGMVRRERA
ncbi:MAG: pyridoxamine 5'-phosphate oxidase family protein [Pseudonocardiaceae bacterium]